MTLTPEKPLRKLKIMEHISLDGVIQNSDDGDGFKYGNWSAPYRTPEGRDAVVAASGERYDLLLGRRTYDLWSGFWPKAPSSPQSDPINAATKYVATHHPESLAWGPVQGVGSDIANDVRRLKAEDGPDILLWGSSTLASHLLNQGLADEVVLIIYPVLLGKGKRFFAEGTSSRAFELMSSQAFPSGVVLNAYRVTGPLQT